MGWDAYAVYKDGGEVTGNAWEFYEHVIWSSFLSADAAVRGTCEQNVDRGLKKGRLDHPACGEAFETLYEVDAWPPGEVDKYDLSSEKVQELAAKYDEIVKFLQGSVDDPASQWHLYSVLEFVKACAKHNLAIMFGY